MADKEREGVSGEELDFLTSILLEGQELEITFTSHWKGDFHVKGTLLIKERGTVIEPKRGNVLHPKAVAWMRTHPKYWRILCGLEPADLSTNINIMGMLVRAGLTELAEMMCRRIDVMQFPLYYKDNR